MWAGPRKYAIRPEPSEQVSQERGQICATDDRRFYKPQLPSSFLITSLKSKALVSTRALTRVDRCRDPAALALCGVCWAVRELEGVRGEGLMPQV